MCECLFLAVICRLIKFSNKYLETWYWRSTDVLLQRNTMLFSPKTVKLFLYSYHHRRSRQRQAKSRWFCWGSRLCPGGFRLPWCLSVWHLGSSRRCKKWQSLDQFSAWLCVSVFLHWDWYYQSILLSDVTAFLFSNLGCNWLSIIQQKGLEMSFQFHMFIIKLWQLWTQDFNCRVNTLSLNPCVQRPEVCSVIDTQCR